MDDYFSKMLDNQSSAKVGDFAWVLHTYYTMLSTQGADKNKMKERVLPKLTVVIDKYRSLLQEHDGVYHLLQTESPEYEGFKRYDNSNYNLVLLRWALQAAELICAENDVQYSPVIFGRIYNKNSILIHWIIMAL